MDQKQAQISILTNIKGLILDMDGVLWRANQPIGSTPAIFERIRMLGLKVVLATNNATRSVPQYLERMRSLGVELETWQIVNSAQATARYLKTRFPQGGGVYIIGEGGLISTLMEAGFSLIEQDPLAVVVAMDRGLTYDKLRIAAKGIRSGALFIATNTDPTFPTPEGLVPGAGAIVAAVETATNIQAMIIGKPSPAMYHLALERLALPADKVLAVGDRLTTDIDGGQAAGCPTALVLSGVTGLAEVEAWSHPPDIIAQDLTEILEWISEVRQLSNKL
jgi:4-nitrophenyl phosphatase